MVGTNDNSSCSLPHDLPVTIKIVVLRLEMFEMVEVDGIQDESSGAVKGESAVGLVSLDDERACPHAGDGHVPCLAADAP